MSSHILRYVAVPIHVRYYIFRANLFSDMPVMGKKKSPVTLGNETTRQGAETRHHLVCTAPVDTKKQRGAGGPSRSVWKRGGAGMGRWLGSLEEPCSWEPGGILPWLWFADMRVGTESDYREMGLPLVALGSVGGNASSLVPSWDGVREGERESHGRFVGVFSFCSIGEWS